MTHKFAQIVFTPSIREIQALQGSRAAYAGMDEGEDYNHRLGERETSFIAKRDSFYMASVSETGWPYVQHRGGPVGFMKVLEDRSIGFADYSGNRQYVSIGNLSQNNRVALFFMDYPNRRRLKLLGRVRTVGLEESDILKRLEDENYPAQVERGIVIAVEGFDWNCSQHITPRYSEAEVTDILQELLHKNQRLRHALQERAGMPADSQSTAELSGEEEVLGEGPLELVVSAVRQLAPRVRAFELRNPQGGELPAVEPGSHLRIPVRLPGGKLVERDYSIASNPARREIYEIAVLWEEQGGGASRAVHESYGIGTRLRVNPPANHFSLHDDDRPALLIAGGIGITPIKPMAQALANRGTPFCMHYAGRSRAEMAFLDRLERQLGDRLQIHSSDEGERLDIKATLAMAPRNALIYACGPQRLIVAVQQAARELGIARDRIRLELFS